MALHEQKWWIRLFGKKEPTKKFDALTNIEAVQEFLAQTAVTLEPLKKQFSDLEELEKERIVGTKSLQLMNLEAQIKLLDKIIENYMIFEEDTDVHGLRLKMLAQNVLQEAEKEGLKDLVKTKKKDLKWKFYW